jgi:Tfp pilus assembly protein PilN
MINLLPPNYADKIKFGRQNTTLRLWIIGALVAIGGLIIIIAGGWLYLKNQTSNLQSELDKKNTQLQAQNIDKVKKDAAEISGDIRVINKVLSNEVRFSDLIQDVGKIMPPGAVLSSLSLSKVNGALDLSTNAKDYTSAAQIAVNLNDPANGLFSKVDIVSINCSAETTSPYKCSGTYKALFNAAAQKKYLSVPQGNEP